MPFLAWSPALFPKIGGPHPRNHFKTPATLQILMPTKTKTVKLPARSRGGAAPSSKTTSNGASAKSSKGGKYVYTWGDGKADGDGSQKALLGGKGANLAEMTRIGLPVPPGFTITTEVCTYFYDHKRTYPAELQAQIEAGVAQHGEDHGLRSSATSKDIPLLVAVRSGARDSMPGMMDTILNLGLNDETVLALVAATKNERFAWDCYRRFIQMYGDVVMGVQKRDGEDHEPFEGDHRALQGRDATARTTSTTPKLTADDLQGTRRALQEARQGAHRQELSRTIRGSSSRAPSAPSSARG